MTNALRWIAAVPAALVSFVASFMLLASLRGLLLRFCPDGDLGTEWTSDTNFIPERRHGRGTSNSSDLGR